MGPAYDGGDCVAGNETGDYFQYAWKWFVVRKAAFSMLKKR
jgi:hypothetical protein